MSKPITQYWYRGRPNYVNRPYTNRHVNACKELNRLLKRISKLEAEIRILKGDNYTPEDLHAVFGAGGEVWKYD